MRERLTTEKENGTGGACRSPTTSGSAIHRNSPLGNRPAGRRDNRCSAIRRRLHLSPAIAIMALVFAMTGGAFAVTGGRGGRGSGGAQGAGVSASSGHAGGVSVLATESKAKSKSKAGSRADGSRGQDGRPDPRGRRVPWVHRGPPAPRGPAGANGTDGTNGTSVTTAAASASECGKRAARRSHPPAAQARCATA